MGELRREKSWKNDGNAEIYKSIDEKQAVLGTCYLTCIFNAVVWE